MLRHCVRFALAIFLLIYGAASATAVPQFIHYSGRLSDGTGWGQSGAHSITITLWSCCDPQEASCTSPCDPGVGALWTARYDGVPVTDGYFSLILDEGEDPQLPGTPVQIANFFHAYAETWISIAVDDGSDLELRKPIGTVPYALHTDDTACCRHRRPRRATGSRSPRRPGRRRSTTRSPHRPRSSRDRACSPCRRTRPR